MNCKRTCTTKSLIGLELFCIAVRDISFVIFYQFLSLETTKLRNRNIQNTMGTLKKVRLLGYKGSLIIEFHEHWTCNASEFRMRQLLFSSSQLSVKENNTSGHGIQLITDYITARACTRAWNTFFSILFKKSKQWHTSAKSLTLTAEQLFAKFLDETLWLLQIFLSYKRNSNAKLYNHFSRPFLRLQCVWYIGGKIIQVK